MKIYVASSWKNTRQHIIVKMLRIFKYEVYDFKTKNPGENDKGFHWSEIDPEWQTWDRVEFINSLNHPLAIKGFTNDFAAMEWADVCVLVMPCGRSAHIEAGYFVGAKKPLFILLSDGEPELMYKMATKVCPNLNTLVYVLQMYNKKGMEK